MLRICEPPDEVLKNRILQFPSLTEITSGPIFRIFHLFLGLMNFFRSSQGGDSMGKSKIVIAQSIYKSR
jgi:hypothetical protein